MKMPLIFSGSDCGSALIHTCLYQTKNETPATPKVAQDTIEGRNLHASMQTLMCCVFMRGGTLASAVCIDADAHVLCTLANLASMRQGSELNRIWYARRAMVSRPATVLRPATVSNALYKTHKSTHNLRRSNTTPIVEYLGKKGRDIFTQVDGQVQLRASFLFVSFSLPLPMHTRTRSLLLTLRRVVWRSGAATWSSSCWIPVCWPQKPAFDCI
jgi:hypothetical protein